MAASPPSTAPPSSAPSAGTGSTPFAIATPASGKKSGSPPPAPSSSTIPSSSPTFRSPKPTPPTSPSRPPSRTPPTSRKPAPSKAAFGDVTFSQKITLKPNETQTVTFDPKSTPALHVANPKLWWPNGYGPQNLYTLHLHFVQHGGDSDAHDTTFGIRKITYETPGIGRPHHLRQWRHGLHPRRRLGPRRSPQAHPARAPRRRDSHARRSPT